MAEVGDRCSDPMTPRSAGGVASRHHSGMRSALVAVVVVVVLAPAALADTTSSDSPRDPQLPPSQDFSHVSTTILPATGTWSVAYTFYGPSTTAAWGNLNAQLYTGASQCADFQAQIASFQETPTLPGDRAISGTVIPPTNRMVCAAERLALPPPGTPPAPALRIALKSTHLAASKKGVVRVALKPFNQAATGVVTLRHGGKQIGRAAYKAKSGVAVNVSIKLGSAARRALKRHGSLLVTLTATAQAGTQVATKAALARVRR